MMGHMLTVFLQMSEEERLVVIRFGRDWDPDCMRQDEILYRMSITQIHLQYFQIRQSILAFRTGSLISSFEGVTDRVKNFAVIYVCDLDQVPDFKQMYELYDPMTLMV